MVIVTDILKEPFDEGAKVATRNLVKYIKTNTGSFIVSINSASKLPFVDTFFKLNKLLFNLSFYKVVRDQDYTKIMYIPEASITFFSFIRAKLLNLFTRKDVFVLALQPRQYSSIVGYIVKSIHPKLVITQSNINAHYLNGIGIRSIILPLGVDDNKYREFTPEQKKTLRGKYQIQSEKTVLLHVGHIQKSRNLEWLMSVKKDNPEVEIIIVGSTYNQDNEALYSNLINNGIRIFREYIPDMENIYNLADYYVFPVTRNDGAIETPLSVLEAMACNLPIITTRFGSLPDTFGTNKDFHFIDAAPEITKIVRQPRTSPCGNRERIRPFTWKEIARKLVDIVEH